MRQNPGTAKTTAALIVKDIRRRRRKHHSAEEKTRILLERLRGEDSIAELCRREGIATSLYYIWFEGVPGGQQEAARGGHRAPSHQPTCGRKRWR